jgi:hypothetical protein
MSILVHDHIEPHMNATSYTRVDARIVQEIQYVWRTKLSQHNWLSEESLHGYFVPHTH